MTGWTDEARAAALEARQKALKAARNLASMPHLTPENRAKWQKRVAQHEAAIAKHVQEDTTRKSELAGPTGAGSGGGHAQALSSASNTSGLMTSSFADRQAAELKAMSNKELRERIKKDRGVSSYYETQGQHAAQRVPSRFEVELRRRQRRT